MRPPDLEVSPVPPSIAPPVLLHSAPVRPVNPPAHSRSDALDAARFHANLPMLGRGSAAILPTDNICHSEKTI